jgi:hypothetical protein
MVAMLDGATIAPDPHTVERSMPERLLNEKIRAANVAAQNHREHKSDPWAKFRASLSMARGTRTI